MNRSRPLRKPDPAEAGVRAAQHAFAGILAKADPKAAFEARWEPLIRDCQEKGVEIRRRIGALDALDQKLSRLKRD